MARSSPDDAPVSSRRDPAPQMSGGETAVGDPVTDPLHGVARHGVWQLAATFIPGLYAFLLVAYLLHTVGPEGYAPWAAAAALIGWLTILDAGLSATTAREAARALAGEEDAIARVSAANAAYALLGAVGAVGGALLAPLVPALLELRGPDAVQAWLVGALLALDLGIVVSTAGWVGTLRGARRFDRLLLVNGVQVAVAVAVVLVLLPRLGLVGAAAAQPVGRFASRLLLALVLRREAPWFHARPRWPGWRRLRSLWAFSLPILALQLATQLGMGTDVLVVAAFASAGAVGAYAAGSQLVRQVGYFLFPAIGVLLPSFTAAVYERPHLVRTLLPRSVLIAGLLGGSIFGGMALEGPALLQLWSGQASALSVTVLTLYAVAWAIVTPAHTIVLMLIARGRHPVIGAVVLAEALANLALSVVLAQLIGPAGVAIATLVAVVVDDTLVIPAVSARLLGIPLAPLLLGGAMGLAGGAALALLVSFVPVAGHVGLVVRAVLGAGLLLLMLWVVIPATGALFRERQPPAAAGQAEPDRIA